MHLLLKFILYNQSIDIKFCFFGRNQHMYKRESKSKQHYQYFKSLSPKYPSSAVLLSSQKDNQQKLLKKVHKLKHALKASQKHNEDLHLKIREYRDGHNNRLQQMQINGRQFEQAQRQYQQKIRYLQAEVQKKIKQIAQLRGQQVQMRQKSKYILESVKQKQQTINRLESSSKDLEKRFLEEQLKYQNAQHSISIQKNKQIQSATSKTKILEKQLMVKNTEITQLNREISRLKQSLRDSVYKADKIALVTESNNSRTKQIQEDNKQLKKIISIYQKQSKSFHESVEKNKVETLGYLQKISELEKLILEANFQRKKLEEAKNLFQEKTVTLSKNLQQVKIANQFLQDKYTGIVNYSYELQRDFQRELHTIVKQLTRRHIVSKSVINSMGSSIIYSPHKQGDRTQEHFTQIDMQ